MLMRNSLDYLRYFCLYVCLRDRPLPIQWEILSSVHSCPLVFVLVCYTSTVCDVTARRAFRAGCLHTLHTTLLPHAFFVFILFYFFEAVLSFYGSFVAYDTWFSSAPLLLSGCFCLWVNQLCGPPDSWPAVRIPVVQQQLVKLSEQHICPREPASHSSLLSSPFWCCLMLMLTKSIKLLPCYWSDELFCALKQLNSFA